MRVLLIEDDRLMARSLALMLNGIGVEHETVAEVEAAIDLARVYDYDAILLDLNLPDVHGYEVLRRLRLARVMTPVMIVSGETEVATKVSGFGFGADDHHRRHHPREPQPAQYFVTVHVGQIKVEQDGVVIIHARQVDRRFPLGNRFVLHPDAVEHQSQRSCHQPVVFDQQNTHT